MRPQVLAKMEELVMAGGTILGGQPMKSPSLQNYPQCDREIREIANRMWGGDYYGEKLGNAVGKGYVLAGMDLQAALDYISIPADVIFPEEAPFLWTHRTHPGMEIYFLSNQGDRVLELEPSFRVSGLQPQWWDAVSGKVRQINEYRDDGSRTTVPLSLQKHESCFIVFTSGSNKHTDSGYAVNSPQAQVLKVLESEWIVEFENKEFGPGEEVKFDSLYDWTESPDPSIKYYSGTATYTTEFNMEEIPRGEIFLNLGNVGVLAKVLLNGETLGVTWMAPYCVHVGEDLIEGINKLEIEVVNVWRNRMLGDMELSEGERFTTYTVADLRAGEQLIPSGLMGPVSLEAILD
jgi:hypothetical protein